MTNPLKITPMNGRVLVEVPEAEKISKGGILLTQPVNPALLTGKVVGVPDTDRWTVVPDDHVKIALDEVVMFEPIAGIEIPTGEKGSRFYLVLSKALIGSVS